MRRLTSHGLRHTAATHMVANADDVGELRAAAEVLGHSPGLLLRIYAHTLPESLRVLTDKVARRGGENSRSDRNRRLLHLELMAMVIELSDRAAARLTAAAAARGVSPVDIVEELTATLQPDPQVTRMADASDPLDAFLGCGASGEQRSASIHELRDELSAAQLDQRR